MNPKKQTYETTFIINASLDDAQIDEVIAKVQNLITKNEGELTSVNKWGRRRLAYPIKKKNTGFYVCLEYVAPGDTVSKLNRHFHLEENVLRYLTVVIPKKILKARQAAPPVATLPATEPSETLATTVTTENLQS